MKLDAYRSAKKGYITTIFVPTGASLPGFALEASPPFRLQRRNFEVFAGQDRFLMETRKVIEDIGRQGWSTDTLKLRTTIGEAGTD